jgi:hypothetical protein
MVRIAPLAALACSLALGACAVAPPGPSVMAMPPQGKDFAAFQADDAACRQYASAQIGNGSPADAANQSAVNSAALGTVLGAAAGAAIGAVAGNPALGAAIGAGSGLALGAGAGADAAAYSGASLQRTYDISYAQCMTAKGNNVPAVAQGGYPATPYPAYPAYAGYPYPYYPYPYYPYYGAGFVRIGGGWHRWH